MENNISLKIKKAINDSGFTLMELQQKTGISKSAIQRYASGDTDKIPIDALKKIAKVTDVPASYLMGWDEKEHQDFENHEDAFKNYVFQALYEANVIADKIPKTGTYKAKDLSIAVSLLKDFVLLDYEDKLAIQRITDGLAVKNKFHIQKGNELYNNSTEHATEFISIAPNIVKPRIGAYGGAGVGVYLFENDTFPVNIVEVPERFENIDFIIGVNGDSMEPIYSHDDDVAIKKTNELKKGDIGLFILNGECLIKKYELNKLTSLNTKYKDIIFNDDDNFKCIGKVVGKL